MKILIIEDEEMLARTLAEKFGRSGFDTAIAHTGNTALKMAGEYKPDVILLDILLPGKSGIQVLRRLKAIKKLAKTPVVILSNFSQEIDMKQAFEIGARDYIIKTQYPLSELVERIKTIVSIKQNLI